jgi:hypothetical protein
MSDDLERSLWRDWVCTLCDRNAATYPTASEWQALQAKWDKPGTTPLESFDELKAMRCKSVTIEHNHPATQALIDHLESPALKETMDQPARPNLSFDSQVAALQIGESVSKVRAVDPTTTVERLPDELPEIRNQVRNACAPAVARAKQGSSAIYTVEVGDTVMPSGRLYVVAIVTRLG